VSITYPPVKSGPVAIIMNAPASDNQIKNLVKTIEDESDDLESLGSNGA
jgi:hypothetical protein